MVQKNPPKNAIVLCVDEKTQIQALDRLHLPLKPHLWLKQVEIWFSILSRQCIRRGVFHSVKHLITEIRAYIEKYNNEARPFKWTYSDPTKRITAPNSSAHTRSINQLLDLSFELYSQSLATNDIKIILTLAIKTY